MTDASVYAKPLPRIDDRNRPFWDGAKSDELRVQICDDCSGHTFPDSTNCPHCLGPNLSWRPVSGKGKVWSWCVFHRAYFKGFEEDVPYAVVLVELDEGVRLYSNLVGVPLSGIRCGMRVEAVYEPVTDEVTLIKFREVK